MSGSDWTQTPNLKLYKPVYDADAENWGLHLNANADTLDLALGTSGAGALFLPLAGGTVTGNLTVNGTLAGHVTATGSTASRALQDRFAEVVNVKDFGAKGDGTTDDTAAMSAATAALPANGGVLYVPAGRYLVSGAIYLPSNTTAKGDGPSSVLLASASWPMNGNFPTGQYCFITNKNHAATTLTDHDILVEDLQFDYGAFGAVATPDGSTHQVRFIYAQNVTVRNCTFQVRGQSDAVAILGGYNTLITSCSAYGFINCGCDFWNSPGKGRVIGCYMETASSVQMVNWNPDGGATWTANDFQMTDCTLNATGSANAIPSQLEPLQLGPGSTPGVVSDVVVKGNLFLNASLAIRGRTNNVVVQGNVFDSPQGGGAVIQSYAQFGGSPSNLLISGNIIINPTTTSGNQGVIVVHDTDAAVITDNIITGATFASYSIDTGSNAPVVGGNSAANQNTSAATFGANAINARSGLYLSGPLATAQTDLSHGVKLFDGGSTNQFGIGVSWPGSGNSHFNYISGSAGEHDFFVAGSQVAAINSGGLSVTGQVTATGINNTPIGGTTAAAGHFTTLATAGATTLGGSMVFNTPTGSSSTDLTHHLSLAANGTVGFNVDASFNINYVGYAGHNFLCQGTPIAFINAGGLTTEPGMTLTINGKMQVALMTNAANDVAAASAGVAVGQFYRNGSVVMQRVA